MRTVVPAVKTTREMFVYVDEVMETLNLSRSKSYKIIQQLNQEQKEKGIYVIAGRVSRKYFNFRLGISGESESASAGRKQKRA